MTDSAYFRTKCIYQTTPCLIYFLNGQIDANLKSININYLKQYNLIKNLTGNNNHYPLASVYVVNATCYDDLFKIFKLQYRDLPIAVAYTGGHELANKMEGKFNITNLGNFIDGLPTHKGNIYSISRDDIDYKIMNCKSILYRKNLTKLIDYQQSKENEEDDSDETDDYALKDDM